ncbi:MAG: homocitrate synthase [Desulfobacterales bacterium]|nr:homocitrate synthase [Desulfobacterales bacterium]
MADTSKKRRIALNDTTLRDGAQAPGVVVKRADKLAIARALDAMGIDELEVGTPVMGAGEEEDMACIAALGLGCRLTAWCRARPEDLEAAARCGVDGVNIGLPVSDIQLYALGKDRSWALERLRTLVPQALKRFDHVGVGAQDATRADGPWLIEFARVAYQVGARRLRLADTVGIGRPDTVAASIASCRRAAPRLPLEFHGHNDLGLATANALAAVEAGAEALSVTVNGLGERAGNAALEQVAVLLDRHPDFCCHIDGRHLLSICRRVALASGRPIAPDRPIVGDLCFTHESGIHCHALLRNPSAYEPFAPQSIGRDQRRFALGSHSGGAGIRHLLQQAGIEASAPQITALRDLLRSG